MADGGVVTLENPATRGIGLARGHLVAADRQVEGVAAEVVGDPVEHHGRHVAAGRRRQAQYEPHP